MAEPPLTDLAADTLGGQVAAALEATELPHGYEIHRPTSGPDDHVIVIPTYDDGPLRHLATPGVRRATGQRLVCALADAGFHVRVLEHDHTPLALAVADTDQAAERGLTQLHAAARKEP